MLRTATALVAVLFFPARPGVAHASPAGTTSHRLTLEQVIARAQVNPLARAASHETRAAQARAREIWGARVARLSATSFIAPSPRIRCDNADCTQTSPHDVTINIAGVYGGIRLTATQPLYTGGKLQAALAAANGAARAAAYKEHAVAGDIALQAAQAYNATKLGRELGWMLEDGRDQILKGKKTLERRLAEGSGDVTVQDRLRLETLLAEVEARITEAHQAEETALAALRALVGDDLADVDEEPLDPAEFGLDSAAAGYVGKARSNRPELRAAREGVRAVKQLHKLEKARYWPDLVMVGGANIARAQGVDDPPSVFAKDPFNTTSVGIALALQWNFDPVSQPARVLRARERALQAESLLEAAGLASDFATKRAYSQAKNAKRRLEATRKGEKSARGWVASVLQADAIGVASAKDLADAYVAYFTLRARVLQTIFEWNIAVVALRRAVGEFSAAGGRQ